MKNATLLTNLSVEPFSGKHYHKNSVFSDAGTLPCAICGKPIGTDAAKFCAVVIDGGARWGDEHSDEKDAGYMGLFPIGTDCARKHDLKARKLAALQKAVNACTFDMYGSLYSMAAARAVVVAARALLGEAPMPEN